MIRPILNRIRRNHALEHATIHMLSRRHTGFSVQGNSDHRGFHLNVYGNISEADVVSAVQEAFVRMRNGEHDLAVHPNCGTVLLTTAAMATVAAQAAFAAEQLRQTRTRTDGSVFLLGLPSAVLSAALALVASRPLGLYLQARYTTNGDLGDLQIVRVRRVSSSPVTWFFRLLLTQSSAPLTRSYFVETMGGG